MNTLSTSVLFTAVVTGALFSNSASCQATIESGENTSTIEPLAICLPNPVFPKKVRKKNDHGELVFRITIGDDGGVKDVALIRGSSSLGNAAMETVRQWRYLPAIRGKRFFETTKEIKIQYDFRKDASQPEEPSSEVPRLPQENLMVEIEAGELFRADLGSGIKPPKATFAPNAEYSEEARRERFSGTDVLGMVVGPDGKPRSVWVVRALGRGLDEKAIEAAWRWTFLPATKEGRPVAVVVSVENSFNVY